jgi:hypothetical protein
MTKSIDPILVKFDTPSKVMFVGRWTMMYLIIYQIEHPIKLNKKLTIVVKMANGFWQVRHLVKLNKEKKPYFVKMTIGFLINLEILIKHN